MAQGCADVEYRAPASSGFPGKNNRKTCLPLIHRKSFKNPKIRVGHIFRPRRPTITCFLGHDGPPRGHMSTEFGGDRTTDYKVINSCLPLIHGKSFNNPNFRVAFFSKTKHDISILSSPFDSPKMSPVHVKI